MLNAYVIGWKNNQMHSCNQKSKIKVTNTRGLVKTKRHVKYDIIKDIYFGGFILELVIFSLV